MKIIAMCLVKNEVDILSVVIEDALKWADYIKIADHMSTDGTWELIQNKIRFFEKVKVYGQINEPFSDGIRAKLYNEFKHLANKGDWWCRLDADEIYIDNPRDFLSKIPSFFNIVRGAKFQYYFTDKDLALYNDDPEKYENGNCVSNLKYYVCNESETRFFRHFDKKWDITNLWPDAAWPHLIYPLHIRIKHFQYRYPAQIQQRIDIRSEVRKTSNTFTHEVRANWNSRVANNMKINQNNEGLIYEQSWKDRIVPSEKLFLQDDNYEITLDLMPSKINHPVKQIIRNTILILLGRKNISTR